MPVNPQRDDRPNLPSLYQDRSFWGMTVTQFLGVFNDSVFKQILLLLCVAVVVSPDNEPVDKQFVVQAFFSIAFILFSGISGYWSDRTSKRSIVVGCKVAEIVVMVCAMFAFVVTAAPSVIEKVAKGSLGEAGVTLESIGVPWLLLGIVFLMGTQSAVFGPAKYGILPELARSRDLPRFNGMVQMTTFLALILGPWVGGILLDEYHDALWKAGLVCIAIAVVGTLTSLAVRKTEIAQPNARFHWSSLAVAPETWALLRKDRALRGALLVYSLFWFVAAIVPLMINWLGTQQYGLSNADTSFMVATLSIGIAAGFVLAGKLSAGRVNFGLVRIGAIGLIVTLVLISIPVEGEVDPSIKTALGEKSLPWSQWLGRWGCQVTLVFAGFFAGLFALPVQVFLQSRPPESMKGRVIGTMNLVNWIAIILAALVFYPLAEAFLAAVDLPKFCIFGLAGLLLLPVACFYRPENAEL